jgi:hypothetical protein
VADALSLLDRGAAKGILHRRNAARRKGRLMRLMHRSGLAAAVKPTPAAKPAAAPAKKAPKAPKAKVAAKPAAKTAKA